MILLILGYIVGIILSNIAIDYLQINIWVNIIAFLPLLVILFYCHRNQATKAFSITIIFTFIIIGSTAYLLRYNSVRSFHTSVLRSGLSTSGDAKPFEGSSCSAITGIVTDMPSVKPMTYKTYVKDVNGALYIVYISRTNGQSMPNVGDKIRFSPYPKLQSPPSYLIYQGISATCYSYDWTVIQSCTTSSLHQFQQVMSQIYHDPNHLGLQAASEEIFVIEAMTTGNKTGLSKEMKEQYARAGVSHVLALSGYHLTIIYLILNLILTLLFYSVIPFLWYAIRIIIRYLFGSTLNLVDSSYTLHIRFTDISHVIIIVVVWSFVALTGAPASLVRASIMLTSMLVTKMIGWKSSTKDALWLSCMLMLCVDPFLLFTPSFQLSFLSMIALLYSTPLRHTQYADNKSLKIRQSMSQNICEKGVMWLRKYVVGSVMATVVCSMMTMPLVAYYFGMVPLVSVASNVIVGALATGLLVLAMVWWAFIGIPAAQMVVGDCLIGVTSMLNNVVALFGSFDYGVLMWKPSMIAVVMAYGLILLIWKWRVLRSFVATRCFGGQ